MDIHLEKGMHCVDCHFQQDNHGNTKLYGEVRAAIEITCTDCHGTADESIPKKLMHWPNENERSGSVAGARIC
jgi:formate-dependent nitrite reductase cytochrome c552 subunit